MSERDEYRTERERLFVKKNFKDERMAQKCYEKGHKDFG
jgi:hypothetical protein